MYFKIVNKFDAEMLKMAVEEGFVRDIENKSERYKKACELSVQSLLEQVLRFDTFYGARRQPDKDLGGYAYFLPTLEDVSKFLKTIKEWHGITKLPSEYDDVVAEMEDEDTEFVEQLFIPSSDFALVFTYPRRKSV